MLFVFGKNTLLMRMLGCEVLKNESAWACFPQCLQNFLQALQKILQALQIFTHWLTRFSDG